MTYEQDLEDLGELWRQVLGIDGTPGDAQDVTHPFAEAPPGCCVICGLAEGYRKHDGHGSVTTLDQKIRELLDRPRRRGHHRLCPRHHPGDPQCSA